MVTAAITRRGGLVVWLLLVLAASGPSGQTSLASRIDAIVAAPISGGRLAGLSIAVAKGTETIAEKEAAAPCRRGASTAMSHPLQEPALAAAGDGPRRSASRRGAQTSTS